jgi:hypothetical protein
MIVRDELGMALEALKISLELFEDVSPLVIDSGG